MSNGAIPASSLDNLIDHQIGELAAAKIAKDLPDSESLSSLMQITAATDLTQEQSALLSISHDLQNLLMMMGTIQGIVKNFETYARSLQSQISAIRRGWHE